MADKARILIVEDEAIIAMDLRDTLSEEGYAVVATLPSGEEALELCAAQRPDLVLIDVRLQGELTGLETARLLREQFAVPAVLLTAFYDQEMLRASQQAGVFAYLIKPYDERELCATLATALARSREEQELRRRIQQLSEADAGHGGQDDATLKIRTFGAPLRLELHGKTLTGDQLTRTQKAMLALLLSAPQLKMDREALETELWPESRPERARAAFDTTLLRLRKLLKEATGTDDEKDYLCLKHGVVSIEHSAVDLLRFHQFDARGRELRKHGNVEEALGPLEAAVALWQGEFLAGLPLPDAAHALRQHTTRRTFEDCLWLAEIYATRERRDDQIEILLRALLAEPASEKAMGLLYALLMRSDRQEQGKSLLKAFARELLKDGLSRNEANQTLRRIEQKSRLECCFGSE